MDAEVYYYDDKIRPIESIEFSVLSNEEIKEMSTLDKNTVGIDIPDLYDNMEPKKGGLIDTRLGTTDPYVPCGTCKFGPNHCDGHFGHIDLAAFAFHMGFLPHVKKILSCICLRCSKLLVYKNEKEFAEILKTRHKNNRLNEVRKIAKNVTHCQKANSGCGTPVSKIKIESKKSTCMVNIIAETSLASLPGDINNDGFEGKKKIRQVLTAENCYDILKNIRDNDCKILGLDPSKSRPEDMIHVTFPVPPVQVRPSVKADFMASATMEDDLTRKLADIIKANIRIRKYKESLNDNASRFGHDNAQLLQYHVGTYYDTDSLSLLKNEQKSKQIKSLSSRLKGKEGRIRSNLQGKRVDFSARTVITPDPSLEINELGVPKKIAQNITFPETVTPYNINVLQELVKRGRNNYPGANFVFPISNMGKGRRVLPIDLRYRDGGVDLRYGDIVERHIVSGDMVLLNRQPTLHKISMMGHRIKVVDNDNLSTFRLNVAATTPYNADFDGDEMNIFIPQSIQTMIELEEIADLKRHIIKPATSKPVIGVVQDSLLGAYNLTQPSMRIEWEDVMNIISYTTIDKFKMEKNKQYLGTELFSYILPSKINTKKKTDAGMFIATKGKLDDNNGVLSKAMLGAGKANSLIHLIWDEYGMGETKNFIDNIQRLINNFNLINGFSVGVGDINIPQELEDKMHKMYETKKLEIRHMITEVENNPDLLEEDVFELSVYSDLNTIRDKVSKLIMQNLAPDNNFNIMILSGSKGVPINMGQMGGCVGQQAVEGKRIKKKMNGRTLIYFHQNDDSALARGFIESPYVTGMTPTEFIFHNMSAREGLIDTAIKSVTGDTPIVIMENETVKRVLIGDWIDEHLANNKSDVEHHEERELELLKLKEKIFVPTTNSKGNVTWGEVTALTRHDPGKELYKITTHGGRDVIVTESKALLVWNDENESFEMKDTPLVKIGDYVPVTHNMPEPPKTKTHINLCDYNENMYIKLKMNRENGRFIGLQLSESLNDNSITEFTNNWVMKHNINSNENIKQLDIALVNMIGNTDNRKVPNEAFSSPRKFILGILDGYFSGDGTVTHNSVQVTSASKELIDGISMLCNMVGIFGTINTDLKMNTFNISGQWATEFKEVVTLMLKSKQNKLSVMSPTKLHRNFTVSNDVVLDSIVSIEKIDVNLYPKVYDMTIPSTLNFGLANGLHVVDTAESGYVQRKLIKFMEDISVKYDGTVRNSNDTIVQFIYGDNGLDTARQYQHELKSVLMGNKELEKIYGFTKEELKKVSFSSSENDKYIKKFKSRRDIIRISQIKFTVDYKVLNAQYMLPINFYRIVENTKNDSMGNNKKLEVKYILEKLDEVIRYENTILTCMSKQQAKDKNNLKYNDEKISKTIFNYALHDFLAPKRCIFEYGFNKTQFDYIIDLVVKGFNKAVVEAGEMIGLVAAQSLGEQTTQMSACRASRVLISGTCMYFGEIGNFIDKLLKRNRSKVKTIGKDSVVLDLDKDYHIMNVSDSEKTKWSRISQISRHPANGGLVKVKTKSGRTVTATLTHSFLKRSQNGIVQVKGSDLKKGMRIPIAKNIPVPDKSIKRIKVNGNIYKLDEHFGWFCGAYLAEGCINRNRIDISNISDVFINNTTKIGERFGSVVNVNKRQGEYGPSTTTCFNNKNLANLLKKYFGNGSYNKKIPAFVFSSNKEFINALLKGYFDGDGNINGDPKRSAIRCGSRSEELMIGVSLLLSYNGIHCSRLQEKKKYKGEEKILYTLCIPKKYAKLYKDNIGTNMAYKLEALNKIVEWNERNPKSVKDENDKIPELGNVIAKLGKELQLPGQSRTYGRWAKVESIGRRTLDKYIHVFEKNIEAQKRNDLNTELNILKQASTSDIVWDEITELEYLDDPKEYVYDFTVPGNDSFMINSGVLVHNTLNSIDWEDKIIIKDENTQITKIGEYIDNMIDMNRDNVKYLGNNEEKEMNDTYYLDISDKEIYCPSVDKNGKVSWKQVTALTKHLPINKDGTNTLVNIKTRMGRSVTATKAKSFLTRVNNRLMPTRGDEIEVGSYLPIIEKLPKYENTQIELNMENYFPKNKHTNDSDIIPNVKLSDRTINISRQSLKKLHITSKHDKDIIDNAVNADIYYDPIVSITEIKPTHKYVYDLTVEDNKTFFLANGLSCYDTFHSAGIGGKGTTSLGVPRVKELLSFSKNLKTPMMHIYLDEKYKNNIDMANRIASYIKYTTIEHIRNRIDVYYDPVPYKKGGFMEEDKVTNIFHSYTPGKYSCQSDVNSLPWLLRVEFDKEKMMNKKVTLLDIKTKFCNFWDKRYNNLKLLKKEERLLLDKVTQCSLVSNNDNSKVPILHVRLDMANFDFSTIVNFTDLFIDKFKLKGLNSIDDIAGVPEERVITIDGPDQDLQKGKEYIVYTNGINLTDIRYINGIDMTRTTCNDVVKIYNVYGIEAARASVLKEIMFVLEKAGNVVNFQHISMLVDTMTANGSLVSVDRHGINKMDILPFAKASFEKTVDQFITAAVFSEIDTMNSISARIMAGLVIKGGTGACNIKLDTELLEKSEFIEDMEEKYTKSFVGVTQDPVIKDIVEREDENDIFMPM
jgi:DNA-directed RNA polymerase beta' subunit